MHFRIGQILQVEFTDKTFIIEHCLLQMKFVVNLTKVISVHFQADVILSTIYKQNVHAIHYNVKIN